MPFIRTKLIKGIGYHYLVESFREEGKPRQRVLLYLGQHETVTAAYKHWQEQTQKAPNAESRKHAREMVKRLEFYI